MKIQFLGAAQTVTGSCYLLDTGESQILVDCGMFQGSKAIKERNYGELPLPANEVDAVLLTHAHIDHSGLLPKLYKHGFSGNTYCTRGTADLLQVMLPDSGHIQEMEVERKNRKLLRAGKSLLEPIYTAEEAQQCMKYFRGVDYGEIIQLTPNIRAKFRDAGHILGSAMIEIWVKEGNKETKVVFSGDIGNFQQPIINDPTIIEDADVLLMESTYGSRIHQDKDKRLEMLQQTVKDTFARGGNLIIPAFAVERTQDLLYYLAKLIEQGEVQSRDIYVDSPLAINATDIFCSHPEYFDQETQELQEKMGGACPFYLPRLQMSMSAEQSKQLNTIKGGAIIISASGMCDAGRIKHHLKHNLWRPESTLLFVGYQAQGTLGRRILDGADKVRIHGEEVAVRANIVEIDGFSAHADQENLINWVGKFKKMPGTIFITHGEIDSAKTLSRLLVQKYGVRTYVPNWLERVDISQMGSDIPVDKQLEPEVVLDELNALREKITHLPQAQRENAAAQLATLLQELK
ncbi:MBL fold metallo-hydrolase [Metallumcola ferriviriculae]|uniref:MBL fold metallo-hydrolase n=1 Tax=Metallumcola ferriviriculae TaxID=3039180 RepID=A0AAU0UTA7_9FIRM|nr:MBL fold metallo-hydrolase [Desulfitibacteraceae bacterium MK1]